MRELANKVVAGNRFTVVVVGLVCAGLLAFSAVQFYERRNTSDGSIELDNVQLDVQTDLIRLEANASVQLPPIVQTGLDSGVPLTFVVQLDLKKESRLWFSYLIASEKLHYTLTYYELTRHYRVNAVETDISRNFRSLSAALSGLGDIGLVEFDLNKQQQQTLNLSKKNNESLVGLLDMRLSTSTLPLSLQPIFRSSWKLASEVYRWSIT